ncbi:MAG: UTP--glucose-1-phosphate uridylyltransferase [Bdellovibrionales bacterium]|nr:UTP--glucose-1-phosphate uridylyltransferase [Bdellovibrionales bacterium]
MNSRSVTKVVIPVAGLGSRFLPVTKSLPKELLPIVDTPIIHFIVEEAVRAGLETVVFVTSRPKVSIEDYFDPGDITSLKLEKAGKEALIDKVIALSKKINIVSVRQYEPQGLGHAVLQAAPIVRGQNFSVILGDDIVDHASHGAIGQCIDLFKQKEAGSVIGVVDIPRDQTHLYGIVDRDAEGRVKSFIEKPSPEKSPSTWAMPGRYVFEPEIITALEETPHGKNGELQLTDAMQRLLTRQPFFAAALNGERYDTGDKIGYIMANVAFALKDPLHRDKLKSWLKERIQS